MKRIVDIPQVGKVAFPDHMSDEQVQQAAADLHQKSAPTQQPQADLPGVLNLLMQQMGGPSAKTHQKMAEIAKVLEGNPALAQLAIAGLSAQGASQPSTQVAEPNNPQSQQGQEQQAPASET